MNLSEVIYKSRNRICFLCNKEMIDESNHCDLFWYSCKCGINVEIKENFETKNLEHIQISYPDPIKLKSNRLEFLAEIVIINNDITKMFTGNIDNNKSLEQFINYINKIQVFQ